MGGYRCVLGQPPSVSGHTVTGNMIHNNKVGMYIVDGGSVFRDNTISGNIFNVDFNVYSYKPSIRFDNDFDASNLVEGKPVLILKNPVGETITGDWAMILVLGGDGVTIQNVTTGNNNKDSIALHQTNNSIIRGATVGIADRGINIAGGQNNQIMNNTFVPPIPLSFYGNPKGVYLESTSGNLVSGNLIDGYWYGMYLINPGADLVNNALNGNEITGAKTGIYLYKTSNGWISSNNTIANNGITAAQRGIMLLAGTNVPPIMNNLVTGNEIQGQGIGLALLNSSENTIMNNLFFGHTTLGINGDILVSGSSDTDDRVFGNDFFTGMPTLTYMEGIPIFCDPDTSFGIGNFYDRSVPAERTRYGPCGIVDTPFTEGGLAMNWQAVEQCRDGRDNDDDTDVDLADLDCSGDLYTELEGLPCTDADGDGYAYNGGECGPLDCNDDNAEVNPSVLEVCLDNQDNNCDGQIDECTAEDNVQALIEKLQSEEVAEGTEGSLVSKLGNAIKSLDRENQSAALNQLGAFENEVEAQRGKHLTEDQADHLLQVVAGIRADIEAGATP